METYLALGDVVGSDDGFGKWAEIRTAKFESSVTVFSRRRGEC
jgi:hypothetical protein